MHMRCITTDACTCVHPMLMSSLQMLAPFSGYVPSWSVGLSLKWNWGLTSGVPAIPNSLLERLALKTNLHFCLGFEPTCVECYPSYVLNGFRACHLLWILISCHASTPLCVCVCVAEWRIFMSMTQSNGTGTTLDYCH